MTVYRLSKGACYHVIEEGGAVGASYSEAGRVKKRLVGGLPEVIAAGDEAVKLFDGAMLVRTDGQIYINKEN